MQEFRREIPPGWAPGDSSHPLKLYMEKLQLWYKTTALEDEVVGPMVAGRLHGRAAKVAMTLRVPRPDGAYDVGPEALSRLSVDEVLDPVTWSSGATANCIRCPIPDHGAATNLWAARSGPRHERPGQVLLTVKDFTEDDAG